MTLDDPRPFQHYDEDVTVAAYRLESSLGIERLQDELRRVYKDGFSSYEALAAMIPRLVAKHAPSYPKNGDLKGQSLYDFLKFERPDNPKPKPPSIPNRSRRLTLHAFLMVVDQTYREKWNYNYFVRRAGLTLTEFFATDRKANPNAHTVHLKAAAGLYSYLLDDKTRSSKNKAGILRRCLLLTVAGDFPFLLAFDFDVLSEGYAFDFELSEFSPQRLARLRDWDLDARVGFYIPKRSPYEGIILLNGFKWDWPTVYGSILNYNHLADEAASEVVNILLTDVNSLPSIKRIEKTYTLADYDHGERTLHASRELFGPENLSYLSALFERKFDWGVDL